MFGPDTTELRHRKVDGKQGATPLWWALLLNTHGATAERMPWWAKFFSMLTTDSLQYIKLWNNSLTRPSSIQSRLKTKFWWNKEILHSIYEAHMVKLLSRHPGSLPSQVHTFERTDSPFLGGQKLMQGMITQCGVYSYHQLRKLVWERPRTMCLLSRNTAPLYIIARSLVHHSRVSLSCGG